MKLFTNTPGKSSVGAGRGQIALGLFGLIAPVLTFVLAISTLPENLKIFVLVVLALGYSAVCFWSFRRTRFGSADDDGSSDSRTQELKDSLAAIGEASEFFGSSLKPADMFRLVSSRVDHIFPFHTSALFIASEAADVLKVAQADGANADVLIDVEIPLEKGIAGMAWVSGEVEIDSDLKLERAAIDEAGLSDSRSAVAIPLTHDARVFGVFVLYTDRDVRLDPALLDTLEAIGGRVAPLFLSSISLERSISNALTDGVTRLPNERAFYMILENQLAESQRFRAERPLTVLTIDIQNFADANQSFGYSTGDRMLAFTAENLTSQLRKMDFLSRSTNDEFLIILPTASEKITQEIIQRIRERFAVQPFAISETEEIKIWLHFGWATFWQDGETAEQLLQHARLRKLQAKAEDPGKVLWFPKEYVN